MRQPSERRPRLRLRVHKHVQQKLPEIVGRFPSSRDPEDADARLTVTIAEVLPFRRLYLNEPEPLRLTLGGLNPPQDRTAVRREQRRLLTDLRRVGEMGSVALVMRCVLVCLTSQTT